MFIVIVAHDPDGKGLTASVSLLTNDLVYAIKTARNSEELGYDMDTERSDVHVVQLLPEEIYYPSDFSGSFRERCSSRDRPHTPVYATGKADGTWIEKWYNTSLQLQFEKQVKAQKTCSEATA